MAEASVTCLFPTKVGVSPEPEPENPFWFRLDTSNLVAAITPPPDSGGYFTYPSLTIDNLTSLFLYLVSGNDSCTFFKDFELGVDFNIGDVIDFTTQMAGLADGSRVLFTAAFAVGADCFEVLLGLTLDSSTGLATPEVLDVNGVIGDIGSLVSYTDGNYEVIYIDDGKKLLCLDIDKTQVVLGLSNIFPPLPTYS